MTGLIVLSACDGGTMFPEAGREFGGGSQAADGAPAIARPDPDSRGVITYATYQVMVARNGDTIPAMAARVGLGPEEIATHNGLPVSYAPRPGEVLALPRKVGGAPSSAAGWSAEGTIAALDNSRITTSAVDAPAAAGATVNPFDNGQDSPVVDPVRHRVVAGETAFSVARLYGVSVTSLASWNGLGPDMMVRENQELLIPVTDRRVAAATPAEAMNEPGTRSVVPPPPSAQKPLPENQDIAAVEAPPSPDLAADRTPPGASRKLLTPVAGGTVLRGYAPAGPQKNEGIDYAAAAGTEVRAAEAGEIALISKSLGGLGTIVLVRHPDDLLTVYGRVTDVTLQKGDKVARGQRIGVVADGDTPNVHFEVRRGTQSVDPTPYL